MVLGKLPVPVRRTNLDDSTARAYFACSRCGWRLFGHFTLYHFTSLSPSLWKTARYGLKYCLKGPLIPKQPTSQFTSRTSKAADNIIQLFHAFAGNSHNYRPTM